MNILRIGFVGLDTSHVTAFANLLNSPNEKFHIPGVRVVAAFKGGSEDLDISRDRVAPLTQELVERHGVEIVESIEGLRSLCDAIFIESVDGRVHLEQFASVADWGVPVFIDKPLATSLAEAKEIGLLAERNNVRLFSSSALRFLEPLRKALDTPDIGEIVGGDFYGPMVRLPEPPGFFWYGIHSVEMLFATLGPGFEEVSVQAEEKHDLIIGRWTGGRLGTIRGNRVGNNTFGGTVHFEKASVSFDSTQSETPFYASLLRAVVRFLQDGEAPVAISESIRIVEFIETANRLLKSNEGFGGY